MSTVSTESSVSVVSAESLVAAVSAESSVSPVSADPLCAKCGKGMWSLDFLQGL